MSLSNVLSSGTPLPTVDFATSLPPPGPIIIDSSPIDVSSVISSASSKQSSSSSLDVSSPGTSPSFASSFSSSNSQSTSALQHSPGPTSQFSSTAPPTSQPKPTSQAQTSSQVQSTSLNKTHTIIAPATGGAVGGLAAVCILVAAALWTRRRIAARNRHVRTNDVRHDILADDEHDGTDPTIRTGDNGPEKRVVWAHIQQEGTYNEEIAADRSEGASPNLSSNRTTLVSNRATVGRPHPPSSPQLPLRSLPQPELPRCMQPRQEMDGGVRLAGSSLSLRRASSTNSDGATNRDSLRTLPPPYQPHY